MLEITEAANEVLHRAQAAATRFNPDVSIRVFRRGDVVETAFTESGEPDDEIIEHSGLKIFVGSDIGDGILDVSEEHDRLVVREI